MTFIINFQYLEVSKILLVDYDISNVKLSPFYHSQFHLIAQSLGNLLSDKVDIYVKRKCLKLVLQRHCTVNMYNYIIQHLYLNFGSNNVFY